MKLLERIKWWLFGKELKRQIELELVKQATTANNEHLVAMARLCFIKPSTLVREAHNIKSNAEYLLEMIKENEKYISELLKEKK